MACYSSAQSCSPFWVRFGKFEAAAAQVLWTCPQTAICILWASPLLSSSPSQRWDFMRSLAGLKSQSQLPLRGAVGQREWTGTLHQAGEMQPKYGFLAAWTGPGCRRWQWSLLPSEATYTTGSCQNSVLPDESLCPHIFCPWKSLLLLGSRLQGYSGDSLPSLEHGQIETPERMLGVGQGTKSTGCHGKVLLFSIAFQFENLKICFILCLMDV